MADLQLETDVLEGLRAAWRRTDALFSLLEDEAWLERPIALRQPLLFYLGHLPAFAWNQVNRGLLDEQSFRPDFDELFEFGIDPLDEGDVPREPEWPPLHEIIRYRDEVRVRLMAAAPQVDALAKSHRVAKNRRIYHAVLEHELMHHETLLYMFAQLDESLKDAPVAALAGVDAPTPTVRAERIAIPAGRTTLGAHFDALDFGWDNEFPEQGLDVPAFQIDSLPATNADYMEFVKEGAEPPHNWTQRGSEWFVRGPFNTRPWPEVSDHPAQVSQEQAATYCAWSGARLPTEAELQRAAYATPEGTHRDWPWGNAPPASKHGIFDFHVWESAPVGSRPAGASAWGVHELVGNGWEHTSTLFRPLPGFEAWMSSYPGYSADFFDEKHTVVFGASWATGTPLLRRSFRNWFQTRYPFAYSKFRRVWA